MVHHTGVHNIIHCTRSRHKLLKTKDKGKEEKAAREHMWFSSVRQNSYHVVSSYYAANVRYVLCRHYFISFSPLGRRNYCPQCKSEELRLKELR